MPPIRSPRRLYLISNVTANQDDNKDGIDPATGGTTRPVIAKIKEAIGEYFGLTPMAYNDPLFTAVFGGEGTNSGATFRKRFGGFRDASYTFIAKDQFSISEIVTNPTTGATSRVTNEFKSITVGFPKGHSVTEIIKWLETTNKLSEIRYLRSPSGASTDLFLPPS